MRPGRTFPIAAMLLLAFACGGSASSGGNHASTGDDAGSGDDADTTTDGDAAAASDNVAPLIVDEGPPGTDSVDVPFVSVTLCIPGTTTCQTIDHVTVDTGSSGLRILATELSSDMVLPQPNATSGAPLTECFQFDDGYTWGSVRQADVKINGEIAANIPLQLIGDPAFSAVPSDCSSSGPSEDTLVDFGSKGLIGINQIVADCGSYCSDTSPVQTGGYYSCTGGTCTDVAVPIANQVSNPIAFFAKDNNGAILQFPDVPTTGAKTASGSVIFGIGTQPNNALGSATVLTVDDDGNFTTIFDQTTLATSFIDSGTNYLSFNDTAIPQCTSGEGSGFFCPTSTTTLMAQNKGRNGVTSTVSFSIANTNTLFGNASYTAFDDLGGPGDDGTFDWGFPFFLGRSVYVAIDGATTPGGKGPYFAY